MTYMMSGPSRIMNTDEVLSVVRRPTEVGAGVTYVGGKPVYTLGEVVVFTCVCNVQPMTGRDLELLPEGDRFDDQLNVWTNQNECALMTGDIVVREGRAYQVQSAQDWGSYTQARLVHDQTLDPLVVPEPADAEPAPAGAN